MKKVRVVMLGWEFPPEINGGLGVACHGLASALAKLVRLRVLVPARESGSEDSNRTFKLQSTRSSQNPEHDSGRAGEAAAYEQIPAALDPYCIAEVQGGAGSGCQLENAPSSYGGELAQQVRSYSELATRLALQEDFDLVHAHDWMTFATAMELKRLTGKPLVLHLHATHYDRAGPEARGWIFELEKEAMAAADLIIPVSHYTSRILESHYAVPAEKLRPVHNGAEPVPECGNGHRSSEPLVLFLGRFTPQKGPEYFLEIASKVLGRDPNVRFAMAGKGAQLDELRKSQAFQVLGDRIALPGFLNREQLHELLRRTEVYCMPSVSEPFGLSALEAAQFGIPAVISKQAGVGELLRGALVADYWDTDLMADHIVNLLRDEALRAQVVASAREDIKAATWEAAADKVVAIYREVL